MIDSSVANPPVDLPIFSVTFHSDGAVTLNCPDHEIEAAILKALEESKVGEAMANCLVLIKVRRTEFKPTRKLK